MSKYRRLRYWRSTENWPAGDIRPKGGLFDMRTRAREINRDPWRKHVDIAQLRALQKKLGYILPRCTGNPTMAQDKRVKYFASRLHGCKVYYFKRGGTEYIFSPEGDRL